MSDYELFLLGFSSGIGLGVTGWVLWQLFSMARSLRPPKDKRPERD